MGQMVNFGRTLSQIGVLSVDPKKGWQQKLNEQRSLELYRKIPNNSEYSEAEEMENHLQTAKLHSKSQSLSSAEIFYLLSVNDKRLRTAQMHAALSVARLSTVVAGTIGNCSFGSNNLSGIAMTNRREDTDKKMHAAITSAAALVAASCAEAVKSAGASREQVSSDINMGLETRELGDLLTLTTNTAACLRGFDGLKMRTISNCSLEGQMNNQKDAILLVGTPQGIAN
uniref:VAN3-binding protein-like auxin canalisation domain-containing protein n=1 Tax=Setaria italica TaxID=4555 RepID=K3YYZ1_SETIT